SSTEHIRFAHSMSGLSSDVIIAGAVSAGICFVYGLYRDHLRRRGHTSRWIGTHSRAYFVGLVLLIASVLHYGLSVSLAATRAVMPGHHGLPVFATTPWWILGSVALFGGILVGWVNRQWLPPSSHGVPEVIESVSLRGGSLPNSFGPSYALSSGLTLASMG